MKKITAILILMCAFQLKAQPSYTSANYAQSGDSIFLTTAQLDNLNFDTTGAGFTWDFSSLIGMSQRKLKFRLPTQVGYSIAQWAYLYNSNNVNLSSTDQQSVQLGGSISASNPNDYYIKNNNVLQQKASSYEINTNSLNLKVKNVYSAPDIIYHFPINYLNEDSSQSGYTTNIPGYYYRSTILNRVNVVDGWGSITTPYGTFNNCLRVVSTVTQVDSFAIDTFSSPSTLVTYRDLKWLDNSKKYPVLTVKQVKVGVNFVTQSIEYYDNQQFFQPNAYFVYYPTIVSVGDTVQFQNLSTNAQTYQWNFGDPTSGGNNQSSAFNPSHIYTSADTFYVSLIVYNGSLNDTLIIPVIVNSGNAPTAAFTASNTNVCASNTVQFTNQSTEGLYYQWQFIGGVPSSSLLQNPPLITYNTAGTYTVKLLVTNTNGTDSIFINIVVNDLPASSNAPSGIQFFCQNDISGDYTIPAVNNASNYQWFLYPSNAGTVNSNTNAATVYWNTGYMGTAWLKCVAINNCGEGIVDDSLQIEITVCTTISNPTKKELAISPNPASNNILISNLPEGKTSLMFLNSAGILIKNIAINNTSENRHTFDISDLANGIYQLQLLHNNIIKHHTIIISK
jgi:PKD repeat protein